MARVRVPRSFRLQCCLDTERAYAVPLVRFLVSVAGADFSRVPGEQVELSGADAQLWADGVRAELVAFVEDITEVAPKRAPRARKVGA